MGVFKKKKMSSSNFKEYGITGKISLVISWMVHDDDDDDDGS